MVDLYVSLIRDGLRKVEEVPKKWREAVKAKLDELEGGN